MKKGLVFRPGESIRNGKRVRVLWWMNGQPAVFYVGNSRTRKCACGVAGKIKAARRKALERSKWTCEACGDFVWATRLVHPRSVTVDHVVSMTEGGHPYAEHNIQILCSECHKAKDRRERQARAHKHLTFRIERSSLPPCSIESSRSSNQQPSSLEGSLWEQSLLPP